MRKQDLAPYFAGKRDILKMFPHHQHKGRGKKQRHVYVDNGAPILLVAHIDTVQTPRLDRVNRGAGFDDRLGVYLGHKLVQERPDLFDLLLTDYEETCATTATYFTPTHDYNLVVELDREGEDYVDYGLASDDLHTVLKANGFRQGVGSFSDICAMDHVKCNKINLGLGTKHSHSKDSGFDMGVFERQVKRLMDFVTLYRDRQWPEATGRRGWYWFNDDEVCDRCLTHVPLRKLNYNHHRDRWECDDCFKPDKWCEECESCGDLHPIEDLIYDPLYDGFMCSTCHHALHEEDVYEEDLGRNDSATSSVQR